MRRLLRSPSASSSRPLPLRRRSRRRRRRRRAPAAASNCRRASWPTRSPTTATRSSWSRPATSRCSTRAACCGRPDHLRRGQAGDPRRGTAAADRSGRRCVIADSGLAHPRPEGRADLERQAADRRQAAARRGRGAPQGRALRDALPTVASSCTICADDPTPTWAIRAARVTRDEVGAADLLRGRAARALRRPGRLPAAGEHPRAGRTRASGFLVPQFLQSSIYGFGFKLPYYKVLGPSADATITPFLTTSGGKLVEGQYRRRFDDGGFDVGGVLAFDDGLGSNKQELAAASPPPATSALGQGFIARLRPRRRERQQLPRPVRLFRRRPADQHRRHPPHARQRVCLAVDDRLPEPERGRGDRHHPLRLPGNSPTGG